MKEMGDALRGFFAKFAAEKRVVTESDVKDFMEEFKRNKRQKLDHVPSSTCRWNDFLVPFFCIED